MSRADRNSKRDEYLRHAPNYSAEALVDLRASPPNSDSRTRSIVDELIRTLEAGQRFVLPDYGALFEDTTEWMPTMFHLPYPRTVLEFAAPSRKDDPPGFVAVPRRVVACMGLAVRNAAIIWPINYAHSRWTPNWIGVELPYEQEVHKLPKEKRQEMKMWLERMKADPEFAACVRNPSLRDFAVDLSYHPLSPELVTMLGSRWSTAAFLDTRDEVEAAIQLCAALSCRNVETEIVRPTREAMKARLPLDSFEYHVLMVGAHRQGEPRGGHHASPRTHLRRGHIRRLPGGNVWVNGCLVNPGQGLVTKTYGVA